MSNLNSKSANNLDINNKSSEKIVIATIGKTHGVKGYLKLHWDSDFTDQILKKNEWDSSFGRLEILNYNDESELIRFVGFESKEKAEILTNHKIYSTQQETRELCELGENEFFWFDLIGLNIIENNIKLGEVSDIERIVFTDYFVIKTSDELVQTKLPKSFLIPYIDKYILDVNLSARSIFVIGGRDILEES